MREEWPAIFRSDCVGAFCSPSACMITARLRLLLAHRAPGPRDDVTSYSDDCLRGALDILPICSPAEDWELCFHISDGCKLRAFLFPVWF